MDLPAAWHGNRQEPRLPASVVQSIAALPGQSSLPLRGGAGRMGYYRVLTEPATENPCERHTEKQRGSHRTLPATAGSALRRHPMNTHRLWYPPHRSSAIALLASILFLCTLVAVSPVGRATEPLEQTDVYLSGTDGYHTYRIPAVVLTGEGTLLAFCEGRKTGRGDHGDIDLLLRRSSDGGRSWQPMQLVHEEGGTAKVTIGNPCPVVHRTTGTVWLAFCRENDRVFMTRSGDDGRSWAPPQEITQQVKKPQWGWYATGPGHGIQLSTGRLVFPCDCGDSEGWDQWDKKGRSLIFYSDDRGATWQLGGVTSAGMNECQAVELANGDLLLSMRQYRGPKQRAFATSRDGGLSWSEPEVNPQVYCPVCQASIIRYWQAADNGAGKNLILYSGPGVPGRTNLTVRLSYDEGRTWPVAKVLYEGSSAYSDLVVLPGGVIGCLYERDDYGKITFARFPIQWLTDGADKPSNAANR